MSVPWWRTGDGIAALAAIGIAAAMTTIWSGTLPGLHADEAWSILRIAEIRDGHHRLDGMNGYTGVLHHYLALPLVALLGPVPAALRLTGAFLNVLALVALVLLLARLDAGRPMVRVWTPLLVAVSANFVIQSRFAIEVTMLQPLLFLAAGAALVRATEAPRRRGALLATAAGVMVGIAVYSHLLAAATAGGLAIGLVAGFGPRVACHRLAVPLVAGFLVGAAPRVASLILAAAGPGDGAQVAATGPAIAVDAALVGREVLGRLGDIAYVPVLIGRLLDGDLLFLRTTGQVLLPVVPFLSAALAVFGARQLLVRPWSLSRLDRALLVAFLASLVLTVLISPGLAPRYFVLHGLAAVYLLVRLVTAWVQAGPVRRIAAHAVLAGLAAIQAAYVGVDYLAAFRRSGGLDATFPIGFRLVETSSHFMRTDGLHAALATAGLTDIRAGNFLAWPLAVHDLEARRLRIRFRGHGTWPPESLPEPASPAAAALVFYASEPAPGGGTAGEASHILIGGRRLDRAAGFDPRFAVFRWPAAEGRSP